MDLARKGEHPQERQRSFGECCASMCERRQLHVRSHVPCHRSLYRFEAALDGGAAKLLCDEVNSMDAMASTEF